MDTEKTEITSMPDGMSSEELDALTTGEEPEVVAQEATEVESPPAEEPPVKEEPEPELSEYEKQLMAKDAKIGDFRRKNRDLEIEKAKLEGELQARQAPPESQKSPLEIAEAEYLEQYGSLDGFAMGGDLYRQQKAFEDKQVSEKTAKTDKEKALTTMDREVNSLQSGDLSPDKVGDGADFKSVIDLGKHYLYPSDLLKIEETSHRDGIPAGVRKTYELCKAAILAANNSDTTLLRNAMKVKSQPKPKEKPIDIDALTTEGNDAEQGEAEEDTHSQRLTNFIFGPE